MWLTGCQGGVVDWLSKGAAGGGGSHPGLSGPTYDVCRCYGWPLGRLFVPSRTLPAPMMPARAGVLLACRFHSTLRLAPQYHHTAQHRDIGGELCLKGHLAVDSHDILALLAQSFTTDTLRQVNITPFRNNRKAHSPTPVQISIRQNTSGYLTGKHIWYLIYISSHPCNSTTSCTRKPSLSNAFEYPIYNSSHLHLGSHLAIAFIHWKPTAVHEH